MTRLDPPNTSHIPRRPAWDCGWCGRPWPCAPAKVDLAEEYAGNSVSLAVYLAAQMHDCVDDMRTGVIVPGDLFDRFLGWDRTTGLS